MPSLRRLRGASYAKYLALFYLNFSGQTLSFVVFVFLIYTNEIHLHFNLRIWAKMLRESSSVKIWSLLFPLLLPPPIRCACLILLFQIPVNLFSLIVLVSLNFSILTPLMFSGRTAVLIIEVQMLVHGKIFENRFTIWSILKNTFI